MDCVLQDCTDRNRQVCVDLSLDQVLTLRDSQDRDRLMLLLLPPFRRFIFLSRRWTSSSM